MKPRIRWVPKLWQWQLEYIDTNGMAQYWESPNIYDLMWALSVAYRIGTVQPPTKAT